MIGIKTYKNIKYLKDLGYSKSVISEHLEISRTTLDLYGYPLSLDLRAFFR